MDNLTKEILYILDLPTLLKIKEQCNRYITYAIDNKQVNSKYNVQTRTKLYAELLEEVNSQLVLKQFVQPDKALNVNKNENNSTAEKPTKKNKKESVVND